MLRVTRTVGSVREALGDRRGSGGWCAGGVRGGRVSEGVAVGPGSFGFLFSFFRWGFL